MSEINTVMLLSWIYAQRN